MTKADEVPGPDDVAAAIMSAPTSPPTSRRQKGKVVDCNVRLLDDTVHTVRLPVSPPADVLLHRISVQSDSMRLYVSLLSIARQHELSHCYRDRL